MSSSPPRRSRKKKNVQDQLPDLAVLLHGLAPALPPVRAFLVKDGLPDPVQPPPPTPALLAPSPPTGPPATLRTHNTRSLRAHPLPLPPLPSSSPPLLNAEPALFTNTNISSKRKRLHRGSPNGPLVHPPTHLKPLRVASYLGAFDDVVHSKGRNVSFLENEEDEEEEQEEGWDKIPPPPTHPPLQPAILPRVPYPRKAKRVYPQLELEKEVIKISTPPGTDEEGEGEGDDELSQLELESKKRPRQSQAQGSRRRKKLQMRKKGAPGRKRTWLGAVGDTAFGVQVGFGARRRGNVVAEEKEEGKERNVPQGVEERKKKKRRRISTTEDEFVKLVREIDPSGTTANAIKRLRVDDPVEGRERGKKVVFVPLEFGSDDEEQSEPNPQLPPSPELSPPPRKIKKLPRRTINTDTTTHTGKSATKTNPTPKKVEKPKRFDSDIEKMNQTFAKTSLSLVIPNLVEPRKTRALSLRAESIKAPTSRTRLRDRLDLLPTPRRTEFRFGKGIVRREVLELVEEGESDEEEAEEEDVIEEGGGGHWYDSIGLGGEQDGETEGGGMEADREDEGGEEGEDVGEIFSHTPSLLGTVGDEVDVEMEAPWKSLPSPSPSPSPTRSNGRHLPTPYPPPKRRVTLSSPLLVQTTSQQPPVPRLHMTRSKTEPARPRASLTSKHPNHSLVLIRVPSSPSRLPLPNSPTSPNINLNPNPIRRHSTNGAPKPMRRMSVRPDFVIPPTSPLGQVLPPMKNVNADDELEVDRKEWEEKHMVHESSHEYEMEPSGDGEGGSQAEGVEQGRDEGMIPCPELSPRRYQSQQQETEVWERGMGYSSFVPTWPVAEASVDMSIATREPDHGFLNFEGDEFENIRAAEEEEMRWRGSWERLTRTVMEMPTPQPPQLDEGSEEYEDMLREAESTQLLELEFEMKRRDELERLFELAGGEHEMMELERE
ncbi:hypothetical protein T439DRAFT_325082 [Meredithblackwellia eburnea MCA 4105]